MPTTRHLELVRDESPPVAHDAGSDCPPAPQPRCTYCGHRVVDDLASTLSFFDGVVLACRDAYLCDLRVTSRAGFGRWVDQP